MQKLISWAALLLASLATFQHFSLSAELADRDASLAALQQAQAEPDGQRADLRTSPAYQQLEQRLRELEAKASRRRMAGPADAAAGPGKEAASTDQAPSEPISKEQIASFRSLRSKVMSPGFDYEAEPELMGQLITLARTPGLVEAQIRDLEAAVAANPEDLAQREQLAETYFAKMMTVSGPEQGVWNSRAEKQWQAILERKPQHWRAHFTLGQGYAYYPDALGKTADAIRHLEAARQDQELRGGKQAGGDRTYTVLARMYLRRGDKDKAREVLETGLRYLPGNDKLEKALKRM